MEEKKTKISNKSLKLAIIATLFITLVILIPIGYALFSDRDKDQTATKIGKIEVILKEDWPDRGKPYGEQDNPYDEFGIEKNEKTIWGRSTGDLPAYVRVRCIPVVEYYVEATAATDETPATEAHWVTAPVPQESVEVTIDAKGNNEEANWIKDGEYWYYKNILPAGEDTETMSINWQITELPAGLSGKQIRADVKVILEYAQTTHDMWKELFQINDLPQGVERVQE